MNLLGVVGTRSTASQTFRKYGDAVERVPTRFRGAMREFLRGILTPSLPPSDGGRKAEGRVRGLPANPLVVISDRYYRDPQEGGGAEQERPILSVSSRHNTRACFPWRRPIACAIVGAYAAYGQKNSRMHLQLTDWVIVLATPLLRSPRAARQSRARGRCNQVSPTLNGMI
jgi:hypothetical protein